MRVLTSTNFAALLLAPIAAVAATHISPDIQDQQPLKQMSSTPRTLSDVIGRDRDISIFAGLIRDIESVSSLLDERAENLYILAPSNDAMIEMKSKPWEDADDYQALGVGAYEGDSGESRAHANLRRFVEAHIVIPGPSDEANKSVEWSEGLNGETKAGKTVWWTRDAGTPTIHPDNVEVGREESRVANGAIWVLNGVLKRS